jgi:hypothetical protein
MSEARGKITEALLNNFARFGRDLPQSENVDDRRHGFGWLAGPLGQAGIYAHELDPRVFWEQRLRDMARRAQGNYGDKETYPPVPPSPLGDALGYYDVRDEQRPVASDMRGPR